MNEKIRQLAIQAGGHGLKMSTAGLSLVGEDAIQKFANILVFECVKIAIFKDSGMVASADVAGYMAAGRSHAARAIKEEFGLNDD